jgi:hypothetical protein
MNCANPVVKLVLAIAVMALGVHSLQADVIKQAAGTDFLVFEAEAFDSIEGSETNGFLVADTNVTLETPFGSRVLPPDSNASGGVALYDQPGDGNFVDLATWKLQFATPGVYTFYMRYSMFEDQTDTAYGNEDSFYLPLALGDLPEQDGWFSFPKQGHDNPHEDPPYWEGYFHWNTGTMNYNSGLPIEYEVGAGEVGTVLDFTISTRERGGALDAVAFSLDPSLTEDELDALLAEFGGGGGPGGPALQAGDADMDFDFDQLDLVRVQVAAKYLTGQAATWGEGDWNGAPGGTQGSPPAGNARFDQLDIIAALAPGHYLKGKYAAIAKGGKAGDGQTSVSYNPQTGEVAVDAPAGTQLTSINIDSAGRIFTGAPAANLGGSFDNDSDNNIFKATFGSSFGSLSFGNVAQAGLSEDFVANDLSVVGSLAGGGALGNVDLIYIPEPSAVALAIVGVIGLLWWSRRRPR